MIFFCIFQVKYRYTLTLRHEYTGYFTSFDYTQWQKRDFLLYKERHNKTRWADTLWDKFQRLCYDMDEEFERK